MSRCNTLVHSLQVDLVAHLVKHNSWWHTIHFFALAWKYKCLRNSLGKIVLLVTFSHNVRGCDHYESIANVSTIDSGCLKTPVIRKMPRVDKCPRCGTPCGKFQHEQNCSVCKKLIQENRNCGDCDGELLVRETPMCWSCGVHICNNCAVNPRGLCTKCFSMGHERHHEPRANAYNTYNSIPVYNQLDILNAGIGGFYLVCGICRAVCLVTAQHVKRCFKDGCVRFITPLFMKHQCDKCHIWLCGKHVRTEEEPALRCTDCTTKHQKIMSDQIQESLLLKIAHMRQQYM